MTRTVQISDEKLDYQSILNEFEDSEMTETNDITSFIGYQKIDKAELEETEKLSTDDLDNIPNVRIKYNFSYDRETNIVTLKASWDDENGTEIVDEISGIAFYTSDGEIDAILNVEGDTVYLSDMQDAGIIDNCGWLSKVIKAAVVATVAKSVMKTASLGLTAVVSVATAVVINKIDKTIATQNYNSNSKQAEPTTYIYGQSYYKNFVMGTKTLKENGCGVIAVYNVMKRLGKPQKLSDIIYEFDCKSGTLAAGYFGADPSHMGVYFASKGISYQRYYSYGSLQNALKSMTSKQMLIICCWNGYVWEGAHYMAAEKTSTGEYDVYNYDIKAKSNTSHKKDITKSSMGGGIIVAYIVGEK